LLHTNLVNVEGTETATCVHTSHTKVDLLSHIINSNVDNYLNSSCAIIILAVIKTGNGCAVFDASIP